ncbi:MAG: tetratricopeptide repeat protein [Candidatus Eremiobacterota bacterium]
MKIRLITKEKENKKTTMEKCPFCSTSLSKKKNFCFECNSFSRDALFMDEESRKKSKFPYARKEIVSSVIPDLKKILSEKPSDTQSLFNLALAYLNIQSFEESVKLWEKVIELRPSDSIAMNNLGVCHLSLGKNNYAKLVLQKAYKIDSTSPAINYNMASLHRLEGEIQKAVVFYKEYDLQRPGNPFVMEFINQSPDINEDVSLMKTVAPFKIEESQKKSPTKNGSTLDLIFSKYNSENPEEAFAMLEELDLNDIKGQEQKSRLAKIFSQKGSRKNKEEKHFEAAENYEIALKLNQNLPLSGKIAQQYFKAGEKFYDEHLMDRAIETLEKAIKWDKTSPARTLLDKIAPGRSQQIDSEIKSDVKHDESITSEVSEKEEKKIPSAEISLQKKKEEQNIQSVKIPLQTKREKKTEPEGGTDIKKRLIFLSLFIIIVSSSAILIGLKYFKIDDGSTWESKSEEYYFQGLKAEKEGKLDEAITLIEKALKFAPDYAQARNHLGQLYDRTGREEEAMKQFQLAVNINLNYAEAYDNLALICAKLDQKLKAMEFSQLAKENYAAKSSEIHMALQYYHNNQMTMAIKSLEKAITADPEDPALHYNIALAYLKSAQIEKSRESLNRAIKIAEIRGNEDYIKTFSSVLSNLESDDLVVDFIVSGQNSGQTALKSPFPEETPGEEETHPPVQGGTPSIPPPDEDPQVAAVDTTYLFFQNIESKNYNQAYSLLSEEKQKETTLENFSGKFRALSKIKVSSVRILETTDTSIRVKVYLTAEKAGENGSYLGVFQGIYVLLWQNHGWRIGEGVIEETTLKGEDNTGTF